MYKSLNRGALHVQATWEECLPMAKAAGFDGVDPELSPDSSAAQIQDALAQHGLRIGGSGLPVALYGNDTDYNASITALESIAPIAAEAGCLRFCTYILSFSDELSWSDNFDMLTARLAPAAKILESSGCRLGLEFLGPKTLRGGHAYEFIHTMEAMLELCSAAGPNVGLLLDSWHWYTARETVDSVKALRAEQVVYVHVNDAPAGVAIDEQIDNERALHGETGVIDLPGFFSALQSIGYDGPVVPEPFINEFADQPPGEVLARAGAAFDSFWP
ncbi:MAG: sugar phosphate isomerase/epimerase [Verrucomicrobia bacterium]|nr:sugar phosphate isomerase/epimerase [Verrucomicrobiota bacterium]MDA1086979.1 sugar phosphate isomerase/epimerase [Verrucomicrobiota bacterium]